MINPLVYIILLNYKGYQLTKECLESLKLVDYDNFKVIVVDNESNDGSFEKLIEEYGEYAIMLPAGGNNGFSAGNNVGIKYALENGADYVMLLNNDTEVESDFLTKMLLKADENTAVIPCIYYYSDKKDIWAANTYINYNKCICENGNPDEDSYCDYMCGCCVLMPRKMLEEVGLWAEEYFMYYEDMDYSLRVTRANFKIYYKHDAKIYHKVGKSSGIGSRLSIYYNVRNRFYIMKKYRFGVKAYLFSLITRYIRYFQGILKNTNEKVTLKAIKDFKKGKMGKQDSWMIKKKH